jgi:thiol:disulfide interchange protein DsbD
MSKNNPMQQLYKLWPLFVFMCFALPSFAQMEDPLHLETQSVKTGADTYDLIFTVNIDPGWSTYSQKEAGDMGPLPTMISYDTEGGHFELLDEKAEECGQLEEKMDPVFEMKLAKFHDLAVFIQSLKVSDAAKPISGYITMMACDDSKCLPPTDYEFSIDLSNSIEKTSYDKDKVCQGKEIGAIDEGGMGNLAQNKPQSEFQEPLKWRFSLSGGTDNDTFYLNASTRIQDGWKIYGRHDHGFDGPIFTMMYFDTVINASLAGEVIIQSEHKKIGYDPFFELDSLTKIEKSATYIQKVVSPSKDGIIKGFVEYQTCDSTQCLPPTSVPFTFNLKKMVGYNPEGETQYDFETKGEGTPEYAELDYELAKSSCVERESEDEDEGQSFFWIFIGGFLGGFVALLTPCVFPMIPLTVSFFTKSSDDRSSGFRNAIVYGLSIIVIYVLLGLLVTSIFGADALNLLSTNAWFNIFFFLLFVVFALSFFGLFEITLPSSWSNSADKAADRGGLIGIFFMAFTLSLVSFSCTGPIIGTLLVETATGGGPVIFGSVPAGPLVGMLGFSVALALPFALFAAFPSWLNSLPQSGSWMNSVKVLLGFAEIALALKFLSVADLTMGWKILPYELFVGLWLLCALGIALYFFGFLKFPLDYSKPKLTRGRGIVGIIAILLAAYIGTGFTYSERNKTFVTPAMLSGLAPPAGHSYIFPNECPLNLNCFKDFNKGKAYAQEVNKPILLDFTGHGCVNCRKMEDRVWGEEGVYELINEKYVLISLYVDERTALDEPYKSKFDGKLNTSIGNKWADFQAIHFGRNSQPYYVLMSPEGKILNQPIAYTPDVDKYRSFLQCGIERYNELCGNCLTKR